MKCAQTENTIGVYLTKVCSDCWCLNRREPCLSVVGMQLCVSLPNLALFSAFSYFIDIVLRAFSDNNNISKEERIICFRRIL